MKEILTPYQVMKELAKTTSKAYSKKKGVRGHQPFYPFLISLKDSFLRSIK